MLWYVKLRFFDLIKDEIINEQRNMYTISYSNRTYCYFPLNGATGWYCFETTNDYGKQRYALLLQCQNNGYPIDIFAV